MMSPTSIINTGSGYFITHTSIVPTLIHISLLSFIVILILLESSSYTTLLCSMLHTDIFSGQYSLDET